MRANDPDGNVHALLVVPTLLPDEFILGWTGRLANANLEDDVEKFLARLRSNRRRNEPNSDKWYTPTMVSNLTHTNPSELLSRHTLLPWFNCWNNIPRPAIDAENESFNRLAIKTALNRSGLCVSCIDEDTKRWGWTYWRRSHQISGVCHCPTHKMQLKFTSSLDFTSHSPLSAERRGEEIPDNSEFAKRFSEIAIGLMEERPHTAPERLSEKLQGLMANKFGTDKPNILCHFVEKCGEAQISETWVNHSFCGKLTKRDLLKQLSIKSKTRLTPPQVAVTLALLYDDPGEAIAKWRSHMGMHSSIASSTARGMALLAH